MLHSLNGFHEAEIMRYAYAIEYDCCDPRCLYATLETKQVENLYGAGQFNGSSGYEEAACQGLVAGINAASKIIGLPPLVLNRSSSYTGVLIDDLVTKGTAEPYRIMTSRSEFRLLLRQDNAEDRLIEFGRIAGLVSEDRYRAFQERRARIEAEKDRLSHKNVGPTPAVNGMLAAAGSTPLSSGATLADLIRRPQITYECTKEVDPDRPALSYRDAQSVEIEVKYEGYVRRQKDAARRMEKMDDTPLPADLDYEKIPGLRLEAAQKLQKIRPLSLGQAERISGVNPADITVLYIWLSQKKK